ncbi:hypothetical protein [Kitasatospora sp. NPDC093558]|uniref:hypothetical protein n=1 Tax=Kitasatospora sp. NPDC093558 TaxID=3155201 RepID=UPI00343647E4
MNIHSRPMWHVGIAAATLALALTACSTDTQPGAPKQLMPPEQAVQKLNTLLDEALSDVQPKLQYWDEWPRSSEQYSKGLDEHSLGYATAVRNRHIMTKVAPAKYGTLLGMVEQSLKAKGYTLSSSDDKSQRAVFASAPDGSGVGIVIYSAGNINVGASVSPIPVVHDRDPFGTPTPGPTMSNGNPDTVPNYNNPFWSS